MRLSVLRYVWWLRWWWWWSRVVQEQEWMWMIWQTRLLNLRWGSIHLYCVILVGLGCNLFFTSSLHGGWIQSIASDENKHRKRAKNWQTWWVLQLSPSLKIVPGTPCLGIKAIKSSMYSIVTNSLFFSNCFVRNVRIWEFYLPEKNDGESLRICEQLSYRLLRDLGKWVLVLGANSVTIMIMITYPHYNHLHHHCVECLMSCYLNKPFCIFWDIFQ